MTTTTPILAQQNRTGSIVSPNFTIPNNLTKDQNGQVVIEVIFSVTPAQQIDPSMSFSFGMNVVGFNNNPVFSNTFVGHPLSPRDVSGKIRFWLNVTGYLGMQANAFMNLGAETWDIGVSVVTP